MDRLILDKIKKSPKSCLILGPRQVGKSTLLRSMKTSLTINLAKESEFHRYTSEPGRLEQVVEAGDFKTIFIDEIQRIPSLLNSVQALIDESEGRLKFYLSGSSARKLRRGHANLLPGRLFVFHMGGLCGAELSKEIPTAKLLKFGTLPEIALNSNDEFCSSLLDSYAGTYLREEIQAEAVVQNLLGFSRFLTEAALASGQILDYSKIAKRAKISRTTCVRFFEILQDTLMVDRCDSFIDVASVDVIRHPRFYFFDNGVRNALVGSYDLSPERRGIIFEHFLYNQIKNSLLARNFKGNIQFFRTRSGLEVDFIVTIGSSIWAIEAKAGKIADEDLKPLRTFKALVKGSVHCVAVGLNEPLSRKSKDILICDWRTLLSKMGL
jgi:predicted AAA+ superfamily ATPase